MMNPNDKESDVSYDYKGAFTKGTFQFVSLEQN